MKKSRVVFFVSMIIFTIIGTIIFTQFNLSNQAIFTLGFCFGMICGAIENIVGDLYDEQ